MTRTSRRHALGALALAGALGLSACGAQQHAGAAATVGDTRISSDQLRALVDRSLANPQAKQRLGADRATFERRELGQLIDRAIVAAAARKLRVSVTAGEVDARIQQFVQQAGSRQALEQQAEQSGVAKRDITAFVRDLVLSDKIADKLIKDQPVPTAKLEALYKQNADAFNQVHSAHILVKVKATADTILAQVKAAPSRFAALAAQYSIDTSNKAKGGDLGFAPRSQFVKPFADAIFAAKPGSFVEVQTQFGWHVIHVLERKTTTLAEATPQLRQQALKDVRATKLRELFSSTAKKLGVSVSPRYGSWNAKTGQVDPPKNKLSSPTGAPQQSGSGGGQPSSSPTG